VFVPRYYSRTDAEHAIVAARSWQDALRRLEVCPTGGNATTLKKWAAVWEISAEHFDSDAPRVYPRAEPTPLEEVLVKHSTYSRGHLKRRLYEEGLKDRRCELCGQSEMWHGKPMALILDHVNGVRDDNRIENLQIVCPNCAATLDTHCGRKTKLGPRECQLCGREFQPKYGRQKYCSRRCGTRAPKPGVPQPHRRKVERPPFYELIREIVAHGYEAVGRRYGVSGNAVRKWVRTYEREAARNTMGE
jgi:hypothetical protein